MTIEGNIKARRAGREPCQVKGQAGQLSDEYNCGHMDNLCPISQSAMSADAVFVLE